ncbi:hypothetical protein WR25_03042 [Diploscapter pachys]|uniref:Uncharacterized protein n=1 Tax=Diploscapter pachys TaxID=2018661 RepID=A0A2A2K8M0_9BILA|nr:hypothetical protein WR25_03042 [Diploscapter pachys]
MAGMFGLIAAGRQPLQFERIGELELVCEVPDADAINHIVAFMTGVEPFPEGFGGSVYVRWPTPSGGANWHYLGFIANVKPSAIFKVAQLHLADARHSGIFGDSMQMGAHGSMQVGIMVEPLATIEGRQATESAQTNQQSTLQEFADKMIRNLVNFAESYVMRLPNPSGNPPQADFVPLSALNQWYLQFSRRFEQNPYFWRTLNNG